jgi:hypothetical protein
MNPQLIAIIQIALIALPCLFVASLNISLIVTIFRAEALLVRHGYFRGVLLAVLCFILHAAGAWLVMHALEWLRVSLFILMN